MLHSDRRVVVVALGTCLVAFAVPSAASAYRRYRTALERAKLAHFLQDPQAADEGWHEDPAEAKERRDAEKVDGERESDDPLRRTIAARTMWGNPTADVAERYAEIAHQESVRWAPLMPGAPAAPGTPAGPLALVTAPSWVSVGPNTAAFEFNAVPYPAIDAGRVSGILVNPADPAQVIIALSGGGLWKTFNFGVTTPAWLPMGDALPNLAIGAVDASPANFDHLHVGTGDFIDGLGGQMVKTITGGASWSAPIQLSGRDPSGNAVKALRVNVVKVDPANPGIVLVGTDVGLFRSTDAGASYTLVDLPNTGGPARLEKVWTVVYTGQVGGVSRWAASGVYACDAVARPPETFFGAAAGASCTSGNPGDVWTSTDAGGTWTSRKASLPSGSVGRITLAAGTPSTANPPVTVLYAQVSTEDESAGGSSVGFWRSVNSGVNWSSANGTLSNPTRKPGGPIPEDCGNVHNLGDGQAAYNHALAVDPGDNNRVLAGGMLCAMRTMNGLTGPLWENVSHWLPFISPYGETMNGTLSYAHADHHRAVIVRSGTTVRALLATDGGLYWTDTLFAAGSPTNANVVFRGANQGLVTHLVYGMGSGDPESGTPNRVLIGLQDNGTRIRDYAAAPTTFNQVVGGDGFGAAYGRNPASGAEVYWTASNGSHNYCIPTAANAQCNSGGSTVWPRKDPTITCTGSTMPDTLPFKNTYAPVLPAAAPNTFLSSTDHGVFRISGAPSTNNWQSVVTSVVDVSSGSPVGGNCMPSFIRSVSASQSTDGVYGVALSGGRYAVTSGCTGTTCTWTRSVVVGVDLDSSGTVDIGERTSFTTSIAFPPGPTARPAGDVYVAATAAPVTQDGRTPVPDALGHLFITDNRGATFLPLHGNGTGQDLPNVPINVVRYDTADTSNQTLFVGTLLGVYRTTDRGNTWRRYGVGLPLAAVTDMFVGKTGGIVRVGTYGRGVWEIYPNATAERGVSGNGDWDRDVQIDFIDLAALAIRLGTSPAGTSAPYYDWSVDLTGTANAVDDADLSALLAKFGDHP